MLGKRLSVLLAAGSLAMIGAAAPAVADTPKPVPAQAATPVPSPRTGPGPVDGSAPAATDLDPRLVRRCTEARRTGQVPDECRRVLQILEQARPGTAVRATPRFTG